MQLAVNWLCDRRVRVPSLGNAHIGLVTRAHVRTGGFVPAAGARRAHFWPFYIYKIGPAAPPILLLFAGKPNVKLLLFPARSVVLLLVLTVTKESPLNV
jgi:hypothetical protein